MIDAARDLLTYIDASPTPYHAVAETALRLEEAGYTRRFEDEAWDPPAAGSKGYVIRNEGSVIAFHVGGKPASEGGFHILGAHSDSPNLRLKPIADRAGHGVRQLAIEPYGGVLLYTWFDRDCSLAGRVLLRDDDGTTGTVLVDLERPLLRVPSLAIHLQPEIHEQGFKPNANEHLHPLLGLEDAGDLAYLLREALDEEHADAEILGHDLMLYDTQRASLAGADDAFVHAARLDNLASCHAGLSALLAGGEEDDLPSFTRVIAFWDHEEVGSRSAQGAGGPFLKDVLTRLAGGPTAAAQAFASSTVVSADMAHAVHPNYAGKHDPENRPLLGRGPVVKWNQNQSYATDAVSGGRFVSLCRRAGVTPQHFTSRNDMRCGSTIGPITAAGVGLRTVDVGNPMLSMHSCREMCAAADVAGMIRVLQAFFETL